MIYLASPMSHPSKTIVDLRLQIAVIEASYRMAQGTHIYCPAATARGLQESGLEFKWSHAAWMAYDKIIFDACNEIYVLCLNGVAESKGVLQEIRWSEEAGMSLYRIVTFKIESMALVEQHDQLLEAYNIAKAYEEEKGDYQS